ncbi:MAG TPA: hypothetical protein VHU22_02050 [Xanthobacteraceae bacterium]|nr:hypothetical protein [Xanthobacteraceae bacterium]
MYDATFAASRLCAFSRLASKRPLEFGIDYWKRNMTDSILSAERFAERDFSIGHVFNQTFSVLSRNLLPFCLVSLVAHLPNALTFAPRMGAVAQGTANASLLLVFGGLGTTVLATISQAAVLSGAFDDMRGRPVDIFESLKVGLRRFFPLLGTTICVIILYALAFIALVVPGLIVLTMLFVAIPACVVERLGPIKSMGRSARLTKGHRWKIFGLLSATTIVGLVLQFTLGGVGRTIGGPTLGIIVLVLWSAVWGAFNAILGIVAYHDLRVAKEGVDTDQIAAVFD